MLINKKMKNNPGLLIFYTGCADLMHFSTYLCKTKQNKTKQDNKTNKLTNKNIFIKRDLGPFYFASSTGNLGSPTVKSLQTGGLSFLFSRRKWLPMMDMNIIFQENMCLTDPNHYKYS